MGACLHVLPELNPDCSSVLFSHVLVAVVTRHNAMETMLVFV